MDTDKVIAALNARPCPWRVLGSENAPESRRNPRVTVYAGHVGCVIVALNFRQGADAYPSSLVDINYGIRWVKANASARVPQHIFNKSSPYGIRRKQVSRLCPAWVVSGSALSPRPAHPCMGLLAS